MPLSTSLGCIDSALVRRYVYDDIRLFLYDLLKLGVGRVCNVHSVLRRLHGNPWAQCTRKINEASRDLSGVNMRWKQHSGGATTSGVAPPLNPE
jgi:hypothetical protein